METALKCWEFMRCGREEGGDKAELFGVCIAYSKNAGQACWLVAGTQCGGKPHGTFAQTDEACLKCEFYQQFDLAHRLKVMEMFNEMSQEVQDEP